MMLNTAGLGAYYGAYIQDTPVGGIQTVNAYSGAAVPWWCSLWTYADACHPTGTMPVSTPIPPVAPQTEGQMTIPGAWTPVEASAWTAYVQGQVRSAEENTRQAQAADEGSAGATPQISSDDGSPAGTPSNMGLYIALAAIAGLGLFMARR